MQALPFRRSTSSERSSAYLDERTRQVRRSHRRSPARHRPAARTPHRADLRRRHRQDRRARAGRDRGGMSLHKEINFEDEICEHLAAHGWLYAEATPPSTTGRGRCSPTMCWRGCRTTQPKAWDALVKNHGAQAGETLLDRLRASLDQRGTLDVLRHGIELLGLRQPLQARAVQAGAWRSTPTSSPATPPTACASCGRSAIRCTTRTASIWCCSSTACRWRRSN